MKKQVISMLLVLTLLITAIAVIGQAEQTLPAGGAYMVAADGTQTIVEDPAAAWATGNYAYVKLYGETEAFADLQSDLWVDLNGFDLNVDGTGKVYAFDSANDTYDKDACGELTGTAQPQPEVTDPVTGNRYLAVSDGQTTTLHRFALQLTTVSLRPSAAGLYYKAKYNCDTVLAAKATKYGVVLSLNNMPGADFATEAEDINIPTVLTPGADFGNGTVANSGAVFGIMKEDLAAVENAYRGELPIYANPYIQFGDVVVVGDTVNADKTFEDDGFTGVQYSLHKVLSAIDDTYYTYPVATRGRVDQFKRGWNTDGMADWNFVDIAKEEIDGNAPLVLSGNTGYCQVCKTDVTWQPLNSGSAKLALQNGDHYYLNEDVVTMSVAASAADGAIVVPGSGSTACLHLNGKKLHATNTTAIFGNSGTLNIMGDGIVHGNRNIAGRGDAIQINNAGGGVINLYGGTYMKTGTTRGVIMCASSAGGRINIYKDVQLQTGTGITGMRISTGSRANQSRISVYGADLTGTNVAFEGTYENPEKESVLELVDAKIGNIKMNAWDDVIVKGETIIANVEMAEDAKLTIEQMAPGSSISTAAEGVISKPTQYAKQNAGYFVLANDYNRALVKDGAMYIGKDFVSGAPIEEGYCPACEKPVTWEAMPEGRAGAVEGHYYLTNNVTHTATDSSYMSCPGSGEVGCVHLNGHNITSTGYPAIYSGSGILNVMGEGIVTGYNRSEQPSGTAVQANSSAAATKINLYAGTYRAADNAGEHLYAIATRTAGGNINVYADAKIEANDTGSAILVRDTADADVGQIHLYGATVTGNVKLEGATHAETSSRLTIDNATINGTVQVNGLNTVTLNNAPKIQRLEIAEGASLLNIGKLKTGTDITVAAEGIFTQPNENAADYTEYFTAVSDIAYVDTKDNALTYRFDYERKLPATLTDGGKALCAVCNEEVVWTELKAINNTMQTLQAGGHYYLADHQSVTFDSPGASDAFVKAPGSGAACLHLNGFNLTGTNVKAFYGSNGVLNVLGSGIVSGYTSSANVGAAIQVNNQSSGNAINLYSGNYQRVDNASAKAAVIAVRNSGTVKIYKDAKIEGGTGTALYLGKASTKYKGELILEGCTVNGNVNTESTTPEGNYDAILYAQDATINGAATISAVNNKVTLKGKTTISKLTVAEGLLIDVAGLTNGAQINVSANGAFTKTIKALDAEHLVSCFTTADEGDWVISRDGVLLQEAKPVPVTATEQEAASLENLFTGKKAYYGEMHNHAKTGGRSDGNNTLEEWIVHMEEKRIDFATIVDHRQSIHMYLDAWDDACFIGGSEPAVPTLKESNAKVPYLHYNMVFADAAKFEEHLKNIPLFNFTPATEEQGGKGGFYTYANFTVTQMKEMVQSVWDHGGFFVHVHPLFDNYLISDDPLDYWFGDKTGFEVATTEGGSNTMAQKDCVEAYEMWNELLRLNKLVFATLGDDNHKLSDLSSLTTIYSTEQTPQAFVDQARAGAMTAGPVGIRMSVGETITGGIANFDGGRLVLAVGDIHEGFFNEEKRAGHTYGVELYDDDGILFATEIDPTQMNYFAIDTDASQMYYRAVVVDLTDGARVAVGNPIFNSAFYSE